MKDLAMLLVASGRFKKSSIYVEGRPEITVQNERR